VEVNGASTQNRSRTCASLCIAWEIGEKLFYFFRIFLRENFLGDLFSRKTFWAAGLRCAMETSRMGKTRRFSLLNAGWGKERGQETSPLEGVKKSTPGIFGVIQNHPGIANVVYTRPK
jgi:hypothetical protein